MILPIYLYGTSVLRKKAEDITPDYPGLTGLVESMYETLKRSEGIGLAAPQVGLPVRLLVLDLDPLADIYPQYAGLLKTMINARIEETDGPSVSREEGCLSLPGIHEPVSRKEKIKVTYCDGNFVQHTEWFDGYMARVIQHEYDHLEGRLFIDHLSPIRKQLIKSKLNAILKGKVACDYKVKGVK